MNKRFAPVLKERKPTRHRLSMGNKENSARSSECFRKFKQTSSVEELERFETEWEELAKRIHSLKSCVPKPPSPSKPRIKRAQPPDASFELERLERFSLNEQYVQGLVQLLKAHCDRCPGLLQTVSQHNLQFIKDNQ